MAARQLGQELAQRNIGLVYGGASVGTMGELARSVLGSGGDVTGVIPRRLFAAEVAFTELADLRVVETMHERKAQMIQLADGFIALPGGMGTLEEFFEAVTWAQLGLHAKPCGLLDVRGYYEHLMAFLDRAERDRFIGPGTRSLVLYSQHPGALLEMMQRYVPPRINKAAWARGLDER
jgi:uncharacterized protein (TIGR00730 family)